MPRHPHYAFYILLESVELNQVQELIQTLGLNEAWIRITPSKDARYQEYDLLQIEIYDLEQGVPLFAEELAPALAELSEIVITFGFHEEESEAALMIFANQEPIVIWAGDLDEFEAEETSDDETAEPNILRGKEGFAQIFEELIGHSYERFLNASSNNPEAAHKADTNTDLLLRGRYIGIPEGMPRIYDLFSFHQDPLSEENDNEDFVALALLDKQFYTALWEQATTEDVLGFLEAIESTSPRLLGPLKAELSHVRKWIREQPSDKPLASSAKKDLTTYEILAIGSALAFSAGMSVERFDERLLPLLSLSRDETSKIQKSAIIESLADIEDLGVLSAMTEVLPYHVPEGELLECFDDDEIAPLADWAKKGDEYEGSIFLLNAKRLSETLSSFEHEKLAAISEEFLKIWHQAAESKSDFETWKNERKALDDADWQRFNRDINELGCVLSLLSVNHLQPALIFYGANDE